MYDSPSGRSGRATAGARPFRPLLAGAGALLAAGLIAAPAHAAFPGTNGRIAFERTESPRLTSFSDAWGDSDLLTVLADGSAVNALAEDDGGGVGAHDPAASPDGTRVAYVASGVDTESESNYSRIHVAGLDGSADHVLATGDGFAGAPAWSPDGTRIVFVLAGQGTTDEYRQLAAVGPTYSNTLWTVPADGSAAPHQIPLDFRGNPDDPQWSPDGRTIAFDDGSDVYVVAAAGGKPTAITDGPGTNVYPTWAPGGTALAFGRYYQSASIVEVPFEDGKAGDEVTLVSNGYPSRPAYSPDGLKLAWSGTPTQDERRGATRTLHGSLAYSGIMVGDADGSHAKQILSATTPLTAPEWAPKVADPVAPAPAAQAPAVSVAPTGEVKGETAGRCGSRRRFTIRLRPRGERIVLARVIVNGKRVRARHGKRWTATVDLRTMPKRRFKVDITVWTASGKRFHEVRRYWTCTPAR